MQYPKNYKKVMGLDSSGSPNQLRAANPRAERREIADFLVLNLMAELSAEFVVGSRPAVIYVENPFWGFEMDLSLAIERSAAGKFEHDLYVVPKALQSEELTEDRIVGCLNEGRCFMILGRPLEGLPRTMRGKISEFAPVLRELPRFDHLSLAEACRLFYDLKDAPTIHSEPWIKQVQPRDFLVNALACENLIERLKETVLARVQGFSADNGIPLKDFHGLGLARSFIEDLISDLHALAAGQLSWSDVDRGALFAGPPGVGKTSLARTVAKEAGLRFVSVSAAEWMRAGAGDSRGFYDVLQAMSDDFSKAREYAPCIMFIDEIDSIGSRESFSGHNAALETQQVNALLQEIDGFDGRAPFVVLAATNNPDRVDPALRRSGRLDRVIHIPLPNSKALEEIWKHYLPDENILSDAERVRLSKLSLGCTGADIERFTRVAARAARKAKRELTFTELEQQVLSIPEVGERSAIPEETRRRTAFHEAGHALMVTLLGRGEEIAYLTILPSRETAGHLKLLPTTGVRQGTREDYLNDVRVLLAGRAAEELVLGKPNISAGAANDLERATAIVSWLEQRAGLGLDGNLGVFDEALADKERLKSIVNRALGELYLEVLKMLERAREILEHISGRLLAEDSLTGAALRDGLAAFPANQN